MCKRHFLSAEGMFICFQAFIRLSDETVLLPDEMWHSENCIYISHRCIRRYLMLIGSSGFFFFFCKLTQLIVDSDGFYCIQPPTPPPEIVDFD